MTEYGTLPLTLLLPELHARGYVGQMPSYRQLHTKALDAKFRTVRHANRHHVHMADIPAIAGLLGLTLPTDGDAPRNLPRRCTATQHEMRAA
jgi:hypothetical protein